VLGRLILLDSCTRPGLSEAEFHRLFAKCRCGLVMTRRVFGMHVCITGESGVRSPLELTVDDDNESEPVSSGPSNQIIDLTGDSDDERQ
jgi:hypothetical protein